MPIVSPLLPDDIELIIALADTIWRQHYSNIISSAQIEYMLNQRYSSTLIRAQLLSNEIRWKKLVLNKKIIGFSCCILTDNPTELKLDKLYLHPHHQRKGYGAILVNDTKQLMRQNSLTSLVLTVNRNNASAISAYKHYGFKINSKVIIDIGNGFIMDDYLMTMIVPEPPINS